MADREPPTCEVTHVVARALLAWWNDVTPSLARSEPDADEWDQAQYIAQALIASGMIEGNEL